MTTLPAALSAERLRPDLVAPRGSYAALHLFPEVDSTNEQARRLCDRGAPDGTVVIAEGQTAGRGRLGRRWCSERRLGLYVSVLWHPGAPIGGITRWTLAAAIAACEACRNACGRQVTVKWPNDIVHRGRKIAGILAELRWVGGEPRDLIVGTGINVHHDETDFPAELAHRATSLQRLSSKGMLDRERLAQDYLERLAVVVRALRAGRWPELCRRWEELAPDATERRAVLQTPDGARAEGVTAGLDDDGALRLRTGTGAVLAARMADSVEVLGD